MKQNHVNGRIGGTTPAARNLFAVDNGASVLLGTGPPGFVDGLFAGNLIGTDITGRIDLIDSGSKGLNMGQPRKSAVIKWPRSRTTR